MKNLSRARMLTMLLAVTLASTACSGGASEDGELTELRYMVPNAAGSGWDMTARTAAAAMEGEGSLNRVDVFNVDGANGTVGLARLVDDDGNGELVMQMGFGLVAATVSQESAITFSDTTPVAKLIDDYLAVTVPADSEFEDLESLIAAWQAEPNLKIGGGSAIGGADHLAPLLIAEANGISRTDVNYVTFGGSGVLPAVLGGQVDFAFTSAADVGELVEAGELRVLATTGPTRYEGLPDVPTLSEAGTEVEVANWRGVVAPPDLEDAEIEALIAAFDEVHASDHWQTAMERNGWIDAYMTGDEFSAYLEDQQAQISVALEGLDS
ncbi:tripartite tricarboxylate transporter substrate binding protein [Ornithinimicrobium ciconiae]|uniref:Tripartite tricarboxylate transporter substrate binding protein n=1 Tax=Ornithinimicrobium ciconiae TaxID=2594265 RepID=A0A516GE63_9MICO|nr:tripartite tricarboxylate transporter substrate-binding protein [Ornithinimicrobium ciconiae]QDO89823.1 tripartite tricarboxylate transporter substrate binding protein [Ornithinimicrobium ciconiae]